MLHARGGTWLVLVGADRPDDAASVTDPVGTLWVYRWSASGWRVSGIVRGWTGPPGGCQISAVSLTGSQYPDFAVTAGFAADTTWLSVLSHDGGHWHLVPFEYGYTETTVVNGYPAGHGVATEVDATSSAAGPTTALFETYQQGVFRPADPPGRQAPCSLAAFDRAAAAEFTRAACADGWAIAAGARVGLFDESGTKWRVVELDNGAWLGSYPGIYDIPLSLLRRLAARFGAEFQPAVATAPLIATPAMTGPYYYVNGVITVGGAEWFVAEKPVATSAALPGATATVYRWSGSAWLRQGVVEHVPPSLNYYLSSPQGYDVLAGQFAAVTVPGTSDPGFMLEGSGSSRPDVLTDAGGRWHAARYR